MKTPPFLISASLLLWGWQTGLLYAAVPMAVVLEGARLVKTRWEFSDSDIRHISDLCTVILAIVVVLAFNKAADRFLITTIQWLPIVVFPLIAIQQYSQLGMIHGSALLFLFRRKLTRATRHKLIFDISYPYFGLSLISAAGVNAHRGGFYGCLVVLILWALWPVRSRRYPNYLWISLLIVGGALGYAGQLGLFQVQKHITRMVLHYYLKKGDDPFKSITAIGEIGALKPSNHILFRITADDGPQGPLLLRQACYTVFKESSWYATHSGFDASVTRIGEGSWDVAGKRSAAGAGTVNIAIDMPKGRNLLALPGGTFRLDQLDVVDLQKNSLGALRCINEAGLRLFQATYDPAESFNRPPEDGDLKIPREALPAVQTIATSLELHSKPANDAVSAIHAFFMQHFRYSLVLGGNRTQRRDLADFLLRSRTGHCEYFATATVFLLRAAGIPARYVTGYSAGEYSVLENMIIVRRRHAHAWALAYVSGRWVDVDNTPPDWAAIESAEVSALVRVSDLFSFLGFRFAKWRQEIEMEELTLYLILPLLALMIIFIKRVAGKKHSRRVTMTTSGQVPAEDRLDRTFGLYALEKWLNQQGYERPPGETMQRWCERLGASVPEIMMLQEIRPILYLHYRHRFGAGDLTPGERERLDAGVREIIHRPVL